MRRINGCFSVVGRADYRARNSIVRQREADSGGLLGYGLDKRPDKKFRCGFGSGDKDACKGTGYNETLHGVPDAPVREASCSLKRCIYASLYPVVLLCIIPSGEMIMVTGTAVTAYSAAVRPEISASTGYVTPRPCTSVSRYPASAGSMHIPANTTPCFENSP